MIDPARVREILLSHGGHNDRWPERERDAVLRALRDDATLRNLREEELRLDTLIDEWAGRDLAGGADAGRAAALALRSPARWLRWAGGGSIAAAFAAFLAVTPHGSTPPTPATSPGTVTQITQEGAFVSLFTTTPDEEDVI